MVRFVGAGHENPLLSEADYRLAAGRVAPSLPLHLVRAIAAVEVNGGGYLRDGRLKVLFEAHVFSDLTGGRYDRSHPTLSAPRWNRALYWGGAAEYVRLAQAMRLDERAALESASWGAGQTMGFNAKLCHYRDVVHMIEAFAESQAEQVGAIVSYLESVRGLASLRAHKFRRVARIYNGRGYATNSYHLKLSTAAACHAGGWLAGLALGEAGERIEKLQRALNAAGCDAGAVDGAYGPKSASALLAWQARESAPEPQAES